MIFMLVPAITAAQRNGIVTVAMSYLRSSVPSELGLPGVTGPGRAGIARIAECGAVTAGLNLARFLTER
jgi:hypothetical protein